MWLKDNIKELLAGIFGVAFIVFTGMELVPTEAFVGVSVGIVMYYFEERSKTNLLREIKQLRSVNKK